MRLAAVVVMCALMVCQDPRSLGASLPGFFPAQETRGTGSVLIQLRRSTLGDFLEDPSLCFSLRENDAQQMQQQLLCNDRRSKFNVNPFGLRFGKRYNHGYIYRRAVKSARRGRFSPRQPEVLT
ncbi:kisspeptin 2 [Dunckerocampus dactyliophorus]|uniref:kisspeptin 2 n=1 Tax=Dunckerocampus dactyliophorus TaxID=161453 RepID=UPI0024072B77|nr:kisspeptin 2 [Dunckerocampus dactyliophorus]